MTSKADPDSYTLDIQRLIGKVAERHGIRIDFSDPAFYVLSLNEFALKDATKAIVEAVREAAHDFEDAGDRVQNRAGVMLAEKIQEAVILARQQFDQEIEDAGKKATEKLETLHQIHMRFAAHWISAGLLSAVAIFVIGVLVGLALY